VGQQTKNDKVPSRCTLCFAEAYGWRITVDLEHAGTAVLQTAPVMLESDKPKLGQALRVQSANESGNFAALRTGRFYP